MLLFGANIQKSQDYNLPNMQLIENDLLMKLCLLDFRVNTYKKVLFNDRMRDTVEDRVALMGHACAD